MIRRPRVKVALNLSAGRRSISKNSGETEKNIKSDEINNEELVGACNNEEPVSSESQSAQIESKIDNVITQFDNVSNLNENVADGPAVLDSNKVNSEVTITSTTNDNTFKTPMKLSKNDSDTSSQSSMSSKYRKFKFAPRLDAFRKPQV